MRILIVDDSPELRDMLAGSLALFGWESLQAENGRHAIEMYPSKHHQIDAILLDQVMPGMEGLHILPILLKVNPDVPVLMMTSYGSITLATEFMRKGGSGFIEKPITNFDVLKIRLEEAIQLAKHRKEYRIMRATLEATNQLNISKDDFLANLSHELRTPLVAIFPFAVLARRKIIEDKPTEAMAFLDTLLGGQKRLLSFIKNIEYMAQIHTGKLTFQPKPGDLVRLIQEVILDINNRSIPKKLEWHVLGLEKLLLSFDPQGIRTALTELLDNAMKFSPQAGVIEVRVSESDHQALVEILDFGPGIPAGEEESLFAPFTQSSRTKNNAGGTGLGLSVARGFIQRHGGTITVANRPDNQGTLMTFSLPMPRSAPQ